MIIANIIAIVGIFMCTLFILISINNGKTDYEFFVEERIELVNGPSDTSNEELCNMYLYRKITYNKKLEKSKDNCCNFMTNLFYSNYADLILDLESINTEMNKYEEELFYKEYMKRFN